MALFDFLPDEQRSRMLDLLAARSGTPGNLTRPPEQGIEEMAPSAPPVARPVPAPAPVSAAPAARPDDTMGRYRAAQDSDRETREGIARSEWFRGLLGNRMDPKRLEVNAAGDVANEVGLRHQIAGEDRAAQMFPSQLRATNAGASEKESDAALKGARVPFAGQEAAADAAMKTAHATLYGQQAKTGAADLQDKESFRDALRRGDSQATAIVRQLAAKYGGQGVEGASGAEIYPLLSMMEKGWQSEQMVKARREVARLAAGGGMSLSPEALDQAAQTYLTTGSLPQLGMGRAGGAMKTKIANRAAEIDPAADLAGNRAGFAANKGSLQKLQTQADAVNAFERTALANLDQFLQSAKGIVDTGSPLFNLGARAFAEKVAGDPKLTAFNVSRQVAVQEIGKVLSGNMGSVVSDSARHEVEALLGKDASLAQLEAAATILRKDMANRKSAMAAEIADVRARTGGKKPEATESATGKTVTVIWKGKPKVIPAERLSEALQQGATEAK